MLTALLAVLLLWSWSPAGAQADDGVDPQAANLFVDTVDVDVVNVEVYVTDKKGNRIVDLSRDDFELFVDREQLPVSYFYAVEGGVERTDQAEPSGEAAVPTPQQRVQAEDIPEEQRLHLVIYVDNINIVPLERNRLFTHVRTFLKSHLRPADRAMIVSYDRSLNRRLAFTSDRDLVSEALYDLEKLSGHAARASDDRREILDAIYEEANPDPRDQVVARAHAQVQAMFSDLEFSIEALKLAVEQLAGLPGRKAVLYLSSGIPMRPGEDLFYAMQEQWGDSRYLMEANRFDASRRFQALANQANAHRVTFYAVDAAGLRTHTFNDASNSSATGGVAIDESHFANLQSPLQLLAEETGGLAIINTNLFQPKLGRVAADFETYYSLGFTPAPEDNAYRKLEVKIKGRKDLRVRHREGYRNKPASARMTDRTLAALNYGYESNDLGVLIELGEGEFEEKNAFLVPVIVKIPIADVALVPQQAVYRGQVRLYLAAQNQDASSFVSEVPVSIEIPSDEIERARGHLYHHRVTLRMQRGYQRLAVGVRDEIGAVTSVVITGAKIGS